MKAVGLSGVDSVSLVVCGCCQQQPDGERGEMGGRGGGIHFQQKGTKLSDNKKPSVIFLSNGAHIYFSLPPPASPGLPRLHSNYYCINLIQLVVKISCSVCCYVLFLFFCVIVYGSFLPVKTKLDVAVGPIFESALWFNCEYCVSGRLFQ